jgi:hypothetical protein
MFKYAILVDKIYMCIEHIKQQIHHPREAESLKIDSEDCTKIWKHQT